MGHTHLHVHPPGLCGLGEVAVHLPPEFVPENPVESTDADRGTGRSGLDAITAGLAPLPRVGPSRHAARRL